MRGGSGRKLGVDKSLIFPPSPNFSLLCNASASGDCGPGAVIVVVQLMCKLFPLHFDATRAPNFAIEVRCLLAVLIVNTSLFDVHFDSMDSLNGAPCPGTLFSGELHAQLFELLESEVRNSVAWKTRLALSLCVGEGTRAPHGRGGIDARHIVWFTMDVVLILIKYLLRHVFIGSLYDFDIWISSHGSARYSMGPLCFISETVSWGVPTLPVSQLYDPYAICVLHGGNHFQVHVRRTYFCYSNIVASTIPYVDSPDLYDSMYCISPSSFRMHIIDPMQMAKAYLFPKPMLPVTETNITSILTVESDHILSSVLDFPSRLVDRFHDTGAWDWKTPFPPSIVSTLPIQRRFAQTIGLLSMHIQSLVPRIICQDIGSLCTKSKRHLVLLVYTVGNTFLVRALYRAKQFTPATVCLTLVTSNTVDSTLVPLSVFLPNEVRVAATIPSVLILGTLTPVSPRMNEYLYVEPVETIEISLEERQRLLRKRDDSHLFGDFPSRLSSFDLNKKQSIPLQYFRQDSVCSDANFNLAVRSRTKWRDMLLPMPRGDPKFMTLVPQIFSDDIPFLLVTGWSTLLWGDPGVFVYDDLLPSYSVETIVTPNTKIGCFECLLINNDDLLTIDDKAVMELIINEISYYFHANYVAHLFRCVWISDEVLSNNCDWVVDGSRVSIYSKGSLCNCQEVFLPFGWTYGPTQNKSLFVRYQIWKGRHEVILAASSPFHHRLAWILTKDFIDPTPRRLMRSKWRIVCDPPNDALFSVASYQQWLHLPEVQSKTDMIKIVRPKDFILMHSGSLVEYSRVPSVSPDSNVVNLGRRLKRRRGKRLNGILARVSGKGVVLDDEVTHTTDMVTLGTDELMFANAPNDSLITPSSMISNQTKFQRRTWRKWEHGYVTVQQQMWMALQVLTVKPNDLNFEKQLSDIADEFSTTPDCSDESAYIKQQRHEGKLLEFDFSQLIEDENYLMTHQLDELIESRFVKYPGLRYEDLWEFFRERSLSTVKRDSLFDLLEFGQQAFMLDTFTPNNCSLTVKNGVGYDSHRVLCEHTAAKLYSESRCLLVTQDFLASRYMLKGLHVNPCNTVHKEGAVKRVVTDLSHGKDKISSYNHSVDIEKHLEAYPRNPLPTLRHVATLACKMRREHADAGYLHGGVVDVRTAYQQYRLSVSKAKLVCTRLFARRSISGVDQDVAVIMLALTGTFGDVGAGDTYAILGEVFHELHNAIWAIWRSVTYVDDMLILAPPYIATPHPFQLQHPFHVCEGLMGDSAPGAPPVLDGTQYVIHQAVLYARNLVGSVLGAQATEPRKSKWFYGCLVGIGWYFNLIYSEFYVLPKPVKLRKIVHYLFNVIPVGSEVAPYTAVRELQGLLCWFSAALPLGKSFVYSLFRCRPDLNGLVTFSAVTVRDLDFWRSLARCAIIYPNLFGTKLENLEFGRRPTWFIRTDACTRAGGGGWLSSSKTWVSVNYKARCFVLRWTANELVNINKWLTTIPKLDSEEDLAMLVGNLHHYCSDGAIPKFVVNTDTIKRSSVTSEGTNPDLSSPALDINVLEFATAVFAVMLWAPLIQNSCVCLGADNTATLCWLVKHKTTNIASDTILKLLAITCAIYNIQLVTEFIPGVCNVIADWLSRVSEGDQWDVAADASNLCFGSQGFFRDNLSMMACEPTRFHRRLISRTILMRSFTVREPVVFSTLLAMLLALKGEDDLSCDIHDTKLKGTLNGIAAALIVSDDGQLDVPMVYEEACLKFYRCPGAVLDDKKTKDSCAPIVSGLGPEYSSDVAGDGPIEGRRALSGWGARKISPNFQGRGWSGIVTSDNHSRERIRASFPLLQTQAMASCHAPSTLRSYNSGWNSWCRFCDFFTFNRYCEGADGDSVPLMMLIQQLQNYIHFECAVRQMQPESIKNVYLAGIADYFDRNGKINMFRQASNHNCVQLVLQSYVRTWKKKHPDSSKVKIAFGLSYAIQAEKMVQSGALMVGGYVCSDPQNLVSYMIGVRVITAIWLGIFFLLRKNEFLPHPEVSGGMQEPCRRKNLRFFDKHRIEIPYGSVGILLAFSVSLNLRFSKTDQSGHGRIVQHEATGDPTTCIVRRLEEYIRVSRDYFHASVDSLLFSVPGLPSDLSSATLTELMKNTTAALGLPAESISAHSLRYGGATALSQAGFPEYIIAFYGGWAAGSVAMRRYIGQSAATRKAVSTHMAQTAFACSVEDLVRDTLANRHTSIALSPSVPNDLTDLDKIMGPAFSSMTRKRQRKA